MSLGLPTLIYLGLYVTQSTQAGNLPPPVIRANPGPIVLYKEPVTIQCQWPADAEAYELHKMEEPENKDGRKLVVKTTVKTNILYIQEMKPDKTGLYRCTYKRGGHWSQLSDPLRLVMTGSYDKPSLSSVSGTVVASGHNVRLQCFSRIKFEAFILTKEDAPQFTQRQSSTAQDNGQQTTFHLDRVTSTQAGTYRCYGAFNTDPDVWSHPSDPLQLEVRDPPLGPIPTEPEHPQESPFDLTTTEPTHPQATERNQTQGHQGILIGFPVAIVLLLLLSLLLFLILRHRHHKAKNSATETKRQRQAAEPMNRLASEARDAQDVTYIQVAFNAPTPGPASAPSLLPRPAQASEYATVAR